MLTGLETSIAVYLGSAFAGLMIGSFLNTVIYRMPKIVYAEHLPYTHFSLALPASHCPHCNTRLTAAQLVPVLSYILLRGKCAFCRQKISLLYPGIELISAMLAVLVVWRFGLSPTALAALLFSYAMLALAVIDQQHKILPDEITLALLWLGLLLNLQNMFSPLHAAVIGAVVGYGAFWILNQLCVLLIKKQGLGYGDMKLLAAIGAWFGWQVLPLIISIAATLGLLVTFLLLAMKKVERHQAIPFGPYLCLSAWLFLLFSETYLVSNIFRSW